MSAATLAAGGLKAIDKKDYGTAIKLLSHAIEDSGTNPNPAWLLARSKAYLEFDPDYTLALDDTERAYNSALARQQANSRGMLVLAQYRRAVVLGAMKRFADADACCIWSQQLAEGKNFKTAGDEPDNYDDDDVRRNVDVDGNYLATVADLPASRSTMPKGSNKMTPASMGLAPPSTSSSSGTDNKIAQRDEAGMEWSRAYMLRTFVLTELQKLPANDPGRKITVLRIPKLPRVRPRVAEAAAPATTMTAKMQAVETAPPAVVPAATAAAPVAAPLAAIPPIIAHSPAKLRVDMYQTTSTVSLTLYAKGVDAQALRVESSETRLRLSNLPAAVAGPSQTVTLTLGGAIGVTATGSTQEAVKTKVTPYKIELQLTKKTPGEKWANWGQQKEEDDDDQNSGEGLQDVTAAAAASLAAVPTVTAAPPATKPVETGPVYPTSSRHGPKDWEKLGAEGDEKEVEEGGGGNDVDSFFKTLFASGSPEMKRAMEKSFVESNGTALSTDWGSVSKGRVAVVPPDGAEEKRWSANNMTE